MCCVQLCQLSLVAIGFMHEGMVFSTDQLNYPIVQTRDLGGVSLKDHVAWLLPSYSGCSMYMYM